MYLAFIPSPSDGVWHLGPLPIRAYALCIVLGVIVAVWLGNRRWVARGGRPDSVSEVAVWMIPFGLVGGRLYHVLTDPQLYFGAGNSPITALYIWRGGLGIWGAVALGALGAYIGCRRRGIKFRAFADALAPGIVLAQGLGRWGNWFNQELFGKPTSLPWGLEIDRDLRPADALDQPTFHPTFLYEFLWDFGVAGLVIYLDRRLKLGFGRAFALYVMAYTLGRGWIEYLRVDTANQFFGVRLNVWTSVIVFAAAAAYFVIVGRRHPGRETDVEPLPEGEDPDSVSDDADTEADADSTPTATEDDSEASTGATSKAESPT